MCLGAFKGERNPMLNKAVGVLQAQPKKKPLSQDEINKIQDEQKTQRSLDVAAEREDIRKRNKKRMATLLGGSDQATGSNAGKSLLGQ